MEGRLGKKMRGVGGKSRVQRKGSVPLREGGMKNEEETHLPLHLIGKSNSLPSLQFDETHPISTITIKDKARLNTASNSSLRQIVPLKPVLIGEAVALEAEHPQSLSFSQYFLTTIQRKQQTAEKNQHNVKSHPKAASVNTSAIHLTRDMERKEPIFPLKREKMATPLRMQLCKVRKPLKPTIAVGITLPSERHLPTMDDHYRAKSAVSLYRIRKSGQKPQTRQAGDAPPFEQPLKDQILVNKLISPIVEQKLRMKKGMLNVTYIQCQPYRIPIDFGLFRNVKKLFGTRLRAMFDMS